MKTKKNQPKTNYTPLILLVVAAIIVAGAAVLVLNNGEEETTTTESAALNPGIITPQDYQAAFISAGKPHFLLDVRTPEEFESGHIADAANIAVQILPENLNAIPKDQPVVIYCRSGNRSAQALEILRQAGYTDVYDMGGIIAWQNAGYPVE